MPDLFHFLLSALVTSLVIEGFTIVTDDGMLLFPVRKFFDKHFARSWFYEPLIGCHICMASIWGAAGFLLTMGDTLAYRPELIILLPVFCLVVAALNAIIYKLANNQ